MSFAYQPLEEILDSEIETLAGEDSLYEYYATPLKPAYIFKKEHLRQIKNFLNLKELSDQFEKTQELIMGAMPGKITDQEFLQIQEEIKGSGKHFIDYMDSMVGESGEKPILLQECFGFSDSSLIHFYSLAVDLMQENEYGKAYGLTVLLTTLAPHVQSYWIAEGICLSELGRYEEAAAIFEGAKILEEENPAPYAYSVDCYLKLKEKEKAKEEVLRLNEVLESYEGNDKETFMRNIL